MIFFQGDDQSHNVSNISISNNVDHQDNSSRENSQPQEYNFKGFLSNIDEKISDIEAYMEQANPLLPPADPFELVTRALEAASNKGLKLHQILGEQKEAKRTILEHVPNHKELFNWKFKKIKSMKEKMEGFITYLNEYEKHMNNWGCKELNYDVPIVIDNLCSKFKDREFAKTLTYELYGTEIDSGTLKTVITSSMPIVPTRGVQGGSATETANPSTSKADENME